MIFSFVLMGALVPLVFVNGNYFDDEATVPQYYYDEHAVDIFNNNGNIQGQDDSCFCDTGCYANELHSRKCCEDICLAAEEKGTQAECKQHCPWYDAIAQHKQRWQKCEAEEKLSARDRREKGDEGHVGLLERSTETEAHAKQTNEVTCHMRTKELAQKNKELAQRLDNARSAIDFMFKVWIPLAVVVPVIFTSLGFFCLVKWKTGKMYNTAGQSGSQMAFRSRTPSWV